MSNIISSNEHILFKYVLEKPEYYEYIKRGFFKSKDLDELMGLAERHYETYKSIPSSAQMCALVTESESDIPRDVITTIYSIDTREYDGEWMERTVQAWIRWRQLQIDLVKSVEISKLAEVNFENVESVINDITGRIATVNTITFDEDDGLDFFDATSHNQLQTEKVKSGYSYVDQCLGGGYDKKELIFYMGQSNIGKCVCGDMKVTVRNKRTGEVRTMPIGEFYETVSAGRRRERESL